MSSVRFFKKAVCLGIAMLLPVGFCPSQVFAEETATVSFVVEEEISGEHPDESVPFTFILEPDEEGTPVPECLTATIEGEGEVAFDDIVYTSSGVFEYTIYQLQGDAEGYTYDNSVYHVEVDVNRDYSGALHTTIVSFKNEETEKSDAFAFINEYDDSELVVETETTTTKETTTKTTKTTTTKASSTKASSATPRTGDDFNLNRMVSVLLLSAMIIALGVTSIMRHKKEKKA
jgi:pilin isopeptide linkage protein